MSELSEKLVILRLADGRGATGGGVAFLAYLFFLMIDFGACDVAPSVSSRRFSWL